MKDSFFCLTHSQSKIFMTAGVILDGLWKEFSAEHIGDVFARLASLSRNPFHWHTVLQGLMHASTWPGTAQAYRLLIGAVLLKESPQNISCDSKCEFCGHDSLFQSTMRSIHTSLNYPKAVSSSGSRTSSSPPFIPKFLRFLVQVITACESPYRVAFGEELLRIRKKLNGNSCPLSFFPSLIDIFNVDGRQFFFSLLSSHFGHPVSKKKVRSTSPSVLGFMLMMGGSIYEAVTVESGRNFDHVMNSAIMAFIETLPKSDAGNAHSNLPYLPGPMVNAHVCAVSLIQVIRHSLVSMFLPPTEWPALDSTANVNEMLKNERLERCSRFMEPSAVLSIIRYMLTRPEAIPTLSGNNDGKFNYVISKIKVVKFDIDRCVCLIKSLKTSSPASSLPSSPTMRNLNPKAAKLALVVKEVNVQVEHEWRIEWNAKRYGTYYGTNVVSVKGLSSQVNLTVHSDDQGPVVDSATISLGLVEHSCSILNSNFISEIVAQAALDWFAEPLTRLLQTASQSAIDQFLKKAAGDFRLNIWNASILKIVPQTVLTELVEVLNEHLPKQGVPI